MNGWPDPQILKLGGLTASYWPTSTYYEVLCDTCKGKAHGWADPKQYGYVTFRPLDHDPHCPARNHVYLEGIGPMIEPRAMVFEKENSDGRSETTKD